MRSSAFSSPLASELAELAAEISATGLLLLAVVWLLVPLYLTVPFR